MTKLNEDQLIEHIANLFHFGLLNGDQEIPLDETPLYLAFQDNGDHGETLSRNPELVENYNNTETDLSLLEIIHISFRNNADI